MAFQEK